MSVPGVAAALESVSETGFAIRGDLDFTTVPEIARATAEYFSGLTSGSAALTVDLGGIGQSDSAGVALLVEILRGALRRDRRLQLLNVPEQMRAIIAVSALEEILMLDNGTSRQ